MSYDFMIIGGGLAGLTAAWKLHEAQPSASIAMIERKAIGGQCVSSVSNGVTFDVGGHFCHNFDQLPEFFQGFTRSCADFEKNTYSYDVTGAGYHGMIQNFLPVEKAERTDVSSLGAFLKSRFGQKIYDLFLKSYNEKINQCDLLTCEVPVFAQDRTPDKGKKSYNSTFKYPRSGGIQALIDWLWKHVSAFSGIYFADCRDIDDSARIVTLSTGRTLHYDRAVFDSSSIASAMGYDEFSPAVLVTNGFCEPAEEFENFRDPAWHYISSPEFPVFRIGSYEICGAAKRDGMIPFYAESPLKSPWDVTNCALFKKVVVSSCFEVLNAYPVTKIGFRDLKKKKIEGDAAKGHFWIGRYGKDEWFSMSDTIQDTIAVVDSALAVVM